MLCEGGIFFREVIQARGIFSEVEKAPVVRRRYAPMELRVFPRVVGTGPARLDIHQSPAFATFVVIAGGIAAGSAADEHHVPLQDSRFVVFVGGGHAAGPSPGVDKQHPVVMPQLRPLGVEQWDQTEPLELLSCLLGNRGPRELADGWQKIEVGREVVNRVRCPMPRPTPEGKGARTALPRRGFTAAHPRIENVETVSGAVVVHQHDNRILRELLLLQKIEQAPDIAVEVHHHAEICGFNVGDFSLERRDVLFGSDAWCVRGDGGDLAEERLVAAVLDELHRLVEIAILAEFAGGLRCLLQVAKHDSGEQIPLRAGIEVEPTILGLVSPATEVPFADQGRAVAGFLEQLRQGDRFFPKLVTGVPRVGHTISELVHAGHQRRARRRARGTDIEIVESHTFRVQSVKVRRLEQRVAMRGQVAVALVIG